MLKNKPIKNKADTMGFLLTITSIPQKTESNERTSKISAL
jgi:hypothetical protein